MKLLLLSLLVLPTIAQASFYAKCNYTGTVQKIERLSTLNVETTGSWSSKTDNYTYVLHVSVTKGEVQPGSHVQKCDNKVIKAIYNKDAGYKVNDQIKLSITQANSRNGSFSELIAIEK